MTSVSDRIDIKREQARGRKRLERERKTASGVMLYATDDWQEFLRPDSLARKAGCEPDDLPAMVLKELVDNAADEGATPKLDADPAGGWVISDDGPGIDPERVPQLFAVNRPMLSSKRKRMPTRGMLGNGLRVVMGWAKRITVETRGVRMVLMVDEITGRTNIIEREDVPPSPGLTVRLGTADDDGWDTSYAELTLGLVGRDDDYSGVSSPWWYGPADLLQLLLTAPPSSTAADVIRDLGLVPPQFLGSRPAGSFDREAAAALLHNLRERSRPIKPENLGKLGKAYACPGYAVKTGIAIEQAGGHVPYVGDDGGPLLSHGESASEQRSFDATCRKFFRFLEDTQINREDAQ